MDTNKELGKDVIVIKLRATSSTSGLYLLYQHLEALFNYYSPSYHNSSSRRHGSASRSARPPLRDREHSPCRAACGFPIPTAIHICGCYSCSVVSILNSIASSSTSLTLHPLDSRDGQDACERLRWVVAGHPTFRISSHQSYHITVFQTGGCRGCVEPRAMGTHTADFVRHTGLPRCAPDRHIANIRCMAYSASTFCCSHHGKTFVSSLRNLPPSMLAFLNRFISS